MDFVGFCTENYGLSTIADGLHPENDDFFEVNHFTNDCHCDYPSVDLPQTSVNFGVHALTFSTPEPPEFLAANHFDVRAPGLGGAFWSPQPSVRANGSDAPTQNFTFRGDTRVCDDHEYAERMLFRAPDKDLDFVALWVRTGILAQFGDFLRQIIEITLYKS